MQIQMQMYGVEAPLEASLQTGTDLAGQDGARHSDIIFSVDVPEITDAQLADEQLVSAPFLQPQKPTPKTLVWQHSEPAIGPLLDVSVPSGPIGSASALGKNGKSVDLTPYMPAVTKAAVFKEPIAPLNHPNLAIGASPLQALSSAVPDPNLTATNPSEKPRFTDPKTPNRDVLAQIPARAVEARASAPADTKPAKAVTLPDEAAARAHLATSIRPTSSPAHDHLQMPIQAKGLGVANIAAASKQLVDSAKPLVSDIQASTHTPERKAPPFSVASAEKAQTDNDLKPDVSKAERVAAWPPNMDKNRGEPVIVGPPTTDDTAKQAAMPVKVVFRPDPTTVAMTDKTIHVSRGFVPSAGIHQQIPHELSAPRQIAITAGQASKLELGPRGAGSKESAQPALRASDNGFVSIMKPTVGTANFPIAQAVPPPVGLYGHDAEKVLLNEGAFDKGSLLPGGTTDPIEARRTEAPSAKIEPLARPVMQQLTQATRGAGNGSIEVRLYPEELGRVRLSLSPGETNVTVQIFAERPETLELIRRNIELFAGSLREEGFTDLAFSFGEAGPDQHHDDASENEHVSFGETREGEGAMHPTLRHANPVQSGQLDIRL